MRTPARFLTLVTMLIVALLAASGCGGSEDDGGSGTAKDAADRVRAASEAKSGGDGSTVSADLKIRIEKVGGKNDGMMTPISIACNKKLPATCNGVVTCPAPSEDAERGALCAWLATDGLAVLTEEIPENQACTMLYGGPMVATVTGSVNGETIDATFSRTNGCEIDRFERASPLWTGVVPSGTGGGAAAGSCLPTNPDAPVSSDDPKYPGSAAADVNCSPPTAAAPDGSSSPAPPVEPDVIDDPPAAFDK